MSTTVDLLRREHANHRKLLGILEHQLFELPNARGETDYDIVKATVDYFLTFPSRHHHPKEDVVFNHLKKRAPNEAKKIGDLLREHEELDVYVRAFAGALENVLISGVFPREVMLQGGRAFIDAMRKHVTEEERLFFDKAEEILGEEDWAAIAVETAEFDEHTAVEGAAGDLSALRSTILNWDAESRQPTSGPA
ncbi:MAG: hypothetical protein HOL85_04815 [Rhodospirillaceae bacterium]|jgi:hemerythrin-like domain-containing protein|nr:hypothetical protein [Rhodospirillaceae bacterium]MBT6136824.1 hypothetical protein [Rhodospirillaceae bacterium]